MRSGATVRVLIAEPQALHAEILAAALPDDRFEVARYGGAVEGLPAAARHTQVLIIGPTMPRTGLAELVPELVRAGSRLLVVSAGRFDESASELLYAGATGFLSQQDSGLTDLADAVTAISQGSTALNPDVVHDVLLRWREQRSAPAAPPAPVVPSVAPALTTRERDVLVGLRDGLTTRLLAKRLGVAEKTIETHKSKLFTKLGARNQSQAVLVAVERGLV